MYGFMKGNEFCTVAFMYIMYPDGQFSSVWLSLSEYSLTVYLDGLMKNTWCTGRGWPEVCRFVTAEEQVFLVRLVTLQSPWEYVTCTVAKGQFYTCLIRLSAFYIYICIRGVNMRFFLGLV